MQILIYLLCKNSEGTKDHPMCCGGCDTEEQENHKPAYAEIQREGQSDYIDKV